MNPPGWYPDPAGTPNTFRWWDGQAWTAATTQTPTTTPAPQHIGPPPPESTPGVSNRTKIIIAVIAGVAMIALIITGVVVVPRVVADPGPSPTSPTLPTGSAGPPSPAPTSGGAAQLNCAGGNQRSTDSQRPIYSAGGLQYEAPDEWGFRYDMSQWTWLDDQAVWGTIDIEPSDEEWAAGVALGGVRKAKGFAEPAAAAKGLVTCLTRYGFANDGSWKVTEESAEDVTVDGMPGHRAVYLLSDGEQRTYPGYQVVALVLDTGRDGSFGTWMSFGPKGEPTTSAQIEAAEKSITGN